MNAATDQISNCPPLARRRIAIACSIALFASTFLVMGLLRPIAASATTPIWESLGGVLTSSPAASAFDESSQDVFVKGNDLQLWHRALRGGLWQAWQPLGGVLYSDPAAAAYGGNKIAVVVKGNDGALWLLEFNGTSWGAWTSLGGVLTSSPAVSAMDSNRLDFFVRGNDQALWHRARTTDGFTDWETLGGVLTSDPAATSPTTNDLEVFVRGNDNALWTISGDGTVWGSWSSLGGVLTTSPSASSFTTSRIDVAVGGNDSAVWVLSRISGTWVGWDSFGGVITSRPAAVTTSIARVDIYVRGNDQALWHAFPGWIDQPALEQPFSFEPRGLPLFLRSGDDNAFLVSGNADCNQGPWGGTLPPPNGPDCSGSTPTAGLGIDNAYWVTDTLTTLNNRSAFQYGGGVWIKRTSDPDTSYAIFRPTTTVQFSQSDRIVQSGPTTTVDGLQMSLQYYAAANSATLRTLVTLVNPSATQSVTPTVAYASNLSSDQFAVIGSTGTSSGDNIYSSGDRWAITSWGNGGPATDRTHVAIANVFAGPGAAGPDLVTGTTSNSPPVNPTPFVGRPGNVYNYVTRDGIGSSFQIALKPRATKSFLFFQELYSSDGAANNSVTGTKATYDSTATLGADRLHGLTAGQLSSIANWKFSFNHFFATGPGVGGGPRTKMFAAVTTGTVGTFSSFLSDSSSARGGDSVVASKLLKKADHPYQLVVGPGPDPGTVPDVKIYDIDPTSGDSTQTGTLFAATMTYGTGFHGGVNVAVGQLESAFSSSPSPYKQIVIAPMSGAKPIKVFRYDNVSDPPGWKLFSSFFPYGTSYSGGMTVAAGDLDSNQEDLRQEVLVGGGPGAAPQVRVFSIDGSGTPHEMWIDQSPGFNPYPGWTGGVNVGAGDFYGTTTSLDELVVGKGPGGDTQVKIFKLRNSSQPICDTAIDFPCFQEEFSYSDGDITSGGGIHVAAGDLNDTVANPAAELILGSGFGVGDPLYKILTLKPSDVDPERFTLDAVFAQGLAYNSGFRGGVNVSGYR